MTAKMIRFCQEYMIDLNATQAAIRAGYSEDTAYSIGSENLSKPDIQLYIQQLQNRAAAAADITMERVLQEYKRLAFFDIRKIYGIDGGLVPIGQLDDDTAAAVVSVKSYEEKTGEEDVEVLGTVREVKIADKLKALDSICKVLGYNAPDKSDINLNAAVNWNETRTYQQKADNGE